MRHAADVQPSGSPCVRVCRYSADGECLGCFRLRSEVAAWARLDEEARQQVAALAVRRRDSWWQERVERRAAVSARPVT